MNREITVRISMNIVDNELLQSPTIKLGPQLYN